MKKKELKRRLDWADRQVTKARSDAFDREAQVEAYKTAYESKCNEYASIMQLKNLEIQELEMQCKELRERLAEKYMIVGEENPGIEI